jgi:pimeloyl-ACP methyl ester carboxylesterase
MDFDYVLLPAIILLIGILVIWLSIRRIRSVSAQASARGRRIAEYIALTAVILATLALAGSASFNAITLLWFRARNPPPGEIYNVHGRKMHLYCTGSGSPAIVLDAGLGNDGLIWSAVQPELAKATRVCSYDRAGTGWSEARPAPRDGDNIAIELHDLLLEAKVTGPIVLMGHSIAGLYIRDYATRYPADLAGIVFVDGSSPLQYDSPYFKASRGGPPQWAGSYSLMRAAYIEGIPRLMGQCAQPIPGIDPQASELLTEDLCHLQVGEMVAEIESLDRSIQEAIHTGPYGSLPILVFSHDPAKGLPKTNPPCRLLDMQDEWSRMQEGLANLSTRGRRIVAKGSSHYIQLDRPDLIVREVSLFIQQIRGVAPQPANYGSTITE